MTSTALKLLNKTGQFQLFYMLAALFHDIVEACHVTLPYSKTVENATIENL